MSLPPKDHRLFHYTPSFKNLRDILTDGFWPKFFAEDFKWMVGSPAFVAFPVVCFCDIPLGAASAHRTQYGPYALAMSKLWAVGREINPVWYICPASPIYDHFNQFARRPVGMTLDTIPAEIKPLLPFLKLIAGMQPQRHHTRGPRSEELVGFENELEWRHTPSCLTHSWKLGNDRSIVTPEDHERSKSHRLLLDQQYLDSIYVTTESERKELIEEFSIHADKIEVLP